MRGHVLQTPRKKVTFPFLFKITPYGDHKPYFALRKPLCVIARKKGTIRRGQWQSDCSLRNTLLDEHKQLKAKTDDDLKVVTIYSWP